METLQFLIKKIIVVIPIIFVIGLIYFVFIKYSPDFSFAFGKKGGNLSDLLPDPKLTEESKPYILDDTEQKINGMIVGINQNLTKGITYVTVDKKGNLIYYKQNQGIIPNNTLFNINQTTKKYKDSDYVRSLSIFSGGHIYTGLTFTGEAKTSMFKNGVFQILVVDRFGKILSIDNVTESDNWAMSGWKRFYVKLTGTFPVNAPCSLIFRPAQGSPDSVNGIYVQVPEMCN